MLLGQMMDHTGQSGTPVVLYNPVGRPRQGVQRLHLVIQDSEADFLQGKFRVVNGAGKEIPFEYVGTKPAHWIELNRWFDAHIVDILADAGSIPSCGFMTLYLQPIPEKTKVARIAPRVKTTARSLENEMLKVAVGADGTYTLTDKQSGAVYKGLGGF